MRFVFLLSLIMSTAQATQTDTIATPFVCSALLALQSEPTTRSRFLYDFVPAHDIDNPPDAIFGAMEWVTERTIAGDSGSVIVKKGSQKEMAHFFFLMAEITDEKVYQSHRLRRAGSRDKFDRGGVRPVPSPARQMQVVAQSGSLDDVKSDFLIVQLDRHAAIWENDLLPAGTQVPREMGILLTREGEQIRAAFLFIDPPR